MTQTSALKLVPAIAPHPLTGRPVLDSVPLRPGFKRSALSRFEDSTWDLAPAVFRTNARICHIIAHFDGIADPGLQRTLREFLYARLNFDIPGHRIRLPPASLRQLFNRIRRFLEFVTRSQGACNLATVDQGLLDAYRKHLIADPQRRAVQVAHLLEVVVDLHHFRDHMPSGGLDLLAAVEGALGLPGGWRDPDERREQDAALAGSGDLTPAQVVAQVHRRFCRRHPGCSRRA